jgi:hypothetical protein
MLAAALEAMAEIRAGSTFMPGTLSISSAPRGATQGHARGVELRSRAGHSSGGVADDSARRVISNNEHCPRTADTSGEYPEGPYKRDVAGSNPMEPIRP